MISVHAPVSPDHCSTYSSQPTHTLLFSVLFFSLALALTTRTAGARGIDAAPGRQASLLLNSARPLLQSALTVRLPATRECGTS